MDLGAIDWDREHELCAKRALYRELMKKDELTEVDKELFATLSRDPDLKRLVDYYSSIKGEQ